MRDTLGLVMLGMGNDPAAPTRTTCSEALDVIEQATSDGQVRRFTGNDYLQDIENGNFAACVAWSGDIAQLQSNARTCASSSPRKARCRGSTRWSSPWARPTASRRPTG